MAVQFSDELRDFIDHYNRRSEEIVILEKKIQCVKESLQIKKEAFVQAHKYAITSARAFISGQLRPSRHFEKLKPMVVEKLRAKNPEMFETIQSLTKLRLEVARLTKLEHALESIMVCGGSNFLKHEIDVESISAQIKELQSQIGQMEERVSQNADVQMANFIEELSFTAPRTAFDDYDPYSQTGKTRCDCYVGATADWRRFANHTKPCQDKIVKLFEEIFIAENLDDEFRQLLADMRQLEAIYPLKDGEEPYKNYWV